MKHEENHCTYLLVYVDDVLIIGSCDKEIAKVKDYLNTEFSIKDLGEANYFLGVVIARTVDGLFISQRKYIMGPMPKGTCL